MSSPSCSAIEAWASYHVTRGGTEIVAAAFARPVIIEREIEHGAEVVARRTRARSGRTRTGERARARRFATSGRPSFFRDSSRPSVRGALTSAARRGVTSTSAVPRASPTACQEQAAQASAAWCPRTVQNSDEAARLCRGRWSIGRPHSFSASSGCASARSRSPSTEVGSDRRYRSASAGPAIRN